MANWVDVDLKFESEGLVAMLISDNLVQANELEEHIEET